LSDRPAGLYLHVPFCARVCPYCDFAVRTGGPDLHRRYVDHLLAEIDLWSDWPVGFDTIYFGGGTPSSLAPADLARILDTVRQRFPCASDTRVFLEANPEDASAEAVRSWRELGVGTLSLGIQSLDPRSLVFLGRSHSAEDARRAVERARAAGFDTVSIDLIYGLPGQRPEDWRAELDRALALEPHHISCYQLTIHDGTRFGLLERRGRLTQLPTDEQAELFRLTHRYLEDAGLPGYEASQFAAGPEHRSKHNLKYWDHTPYLGLGPSAHSFHRDTRWWNLRRTDPWQERIDRGERPIEDQETLDPEDLALEALMTGLRTYAGVDLGRIRRDMHIDLAATNAALIERLEAAGLSRIEADRLVPSLDGIAVADGLAAQFEVARSPIGNPTGWRPERPGV
jgi:putative oxygen-independent coproporphyrinogen III oxidase